MSQSPPDLMARKVIKLTTPYPDWPLIRQTPSGLGILGNYQFIINEPVTECDYWVVCDGLLQPEETICSQGNLILITWEPENIKQYSAKFLAQFDKIITCQTKLKHPNIIYSQQAHPWFVNKSYDELTQISSIPKNKLISIVTSNKIFTKGHQQRYDFALKLKQYFGDLIDIYGRGINDFDDKWDVLAPYKYSIAIENLSCPHWLTEKLPDCFLAETFPFYYGCSNVTDYFESNSFAVIDINDFDRALQIIKNIIEDQDHYERHYKNILASKYKYLDQMSLFPLIISIIKNHESIFYYDENGNSKPKITAKLDLDSPEVSMMQKIKQKLKTQLEKVIKN